MKPTLEQVRKETHNQIERLIEAQNKALKIEDPVKLNSEITRILNEKNKLTIKLMNLRHSN